MRTDNIVFTISLLALAIFFIPTSFCQKNYLPGYIISPDGDTVRGYIDYRNWERNPRFLFFKVNPDDAKSVYSPLNIRGFGVLDENYESAIIETEVTSDKTNDLGYDPGITISLDTGFLQAMVKGAKSLYFFRNKLGKDQFYIRQDSAYHLLVYKKYLKDQDGKSVIAENRKYIGQLTLYLNDCPEIQKKLTTASYQQNSLEDLFLSYYSCTGSSVQFHKKTEKVIPAFGVIAGASLTSLTFHSADEDYYAYLINAGYPLSVNFSGGLFLDVILSRNQGKWSICNELVFTSYKVNGSYDVYISENKYTYKNTTLGYSYIKLNNLVRYKYPVGNMFIYANAGLSNGYAVSEKNYMKLESKLYNQERIEEGKALKDTRRYELGFLAGLGAKYKRFSFEVRYEYGTGMSAYTALKSSVNRLYFSLGFRIL